MIVSTERIADLLVPFLEGADISLDQLRALQTYLDLLLKWNSKFNLTAIRDPEEIVTRHFGESLFAARKIFPEKIAESLIDVGSGAGFPGIPIKIWNGAVELTLIESNQKKSVFLREAVRAIDLKQVSVQAVRAEQVPVKADVVALRAIERFEQALPIARGLVRPGGRLALLIGSGQLRSAQAVLPDVKWQEPIQIPLSQNRALLIGRTGPI